MQYQIIKVGSLETNCYILKKEDQLLVIDPGDECQKIQSYLDGKVQAILITHHHFDHIGALRELESITKAPYYFYDNLEEKEYQIGKFHFEVIFTPGHTEDSICFYFKEEKLLFCGDFIFEGTVGRTDLDSGNMKAMRQSIIKIMQYPQDTKVFPGHGNTTTLNRELENNPYFK